MWRCRRPCVVHRVTTLAVPSRCFEPSASPSLPTPSPTCSRGWWKSWANMEKKCRLVLCVCTWCVWACACRYENITHQYVQVFRDRPWGNFIFASFYSVYWFTLSFVFWVCVCLANGVDAPDVWASYEHIITALKQWLSVHQIFSKSICYFF